MYLEIQLVYKIAFFLEQQSYVKLNPQGDSSRCSLRLCRVFF